MADISKIKTLDGTTYNIKDAVARSSIPAAATTAPKMDGTAAVGTSVKYAKEDHVHPSDTTKLNKTAELLTVNPFAPESLKGPYISKIDNAFYAADKRWNVSITNASNSVNLLFDGNYETNVVIYNGATSVLTMDFSTEANGYFPGYPYGYILVSFYYRSAPASVSGRVYCNYEPHGIGWHDITFSPMPDNETAKITYRGYQGKYNISKLEITIIGDTTNPDGNTKPTQVEMHLDRPDSRRTPFLSKYGEETLYYPLTAPSFIGSLTGNASTATNAAKVNNHTVNSDVPSNAKFTDTTYSANTSKLVTTTVPNVTSVGSAPTLGTAIPADDITAWTTNTPTAFSVSGEKLIITSGTAASLSYTAKSIPNVTSVGSAPTLGTAITVATGSLASNGSGGTVATGITAS